jgi:hypothetical protein
MTGPEQDPIDYVTREQVRAWADEIDKACPFCEGQGRQKLYSPTLNGEFIGTLKCEHPNHAIAAKMRKAAE